MGEVLVKTAAATTMATARLWQQRHLGLVLRERRQPRCRAVDAREKQMGQIAAVLLPLLFGRLSYYW